MKKNILIAVFLISFSYSYSQTKWLKKMQVTTNKKENTKTIQIKYVTKDIEIIDFNDHFLTEKMTVLYWKSDYTKDSLYSYMDYSGDTCFFGINESKSIRNDVKSINEFKIIAGYKCQKGMFPSKRFPKQNITIWFTTDTTFYEYFENRFYNIKGVVLEIDDEIYIRTITDMKLLSKEPDIIRILSSIKRCENKSQKDFNTNFEK